jgi:hypothetical protein
MPKHQGHQALDHLTVRRCFCPTECHESRVAPEDGGVCGGNLGGI